MSIAGALREHITIQSSEKPVNEAGDRAETWVAVATDIPARMQPKRVGDVERAMRPTSETRFVATIRNRSDIAANMRAVWGVRAFTINGILNLDERGQFLSLDLTEISI